MSIFDWLLTDLAQTATAEARQQILDNENILRIIKRLRKNITAEYAAMVFELAQLQIRAKQKFSLADKMLFTKLGYEQATSERIARYKASCFPHRQTIADIGCGIGGDAIGLSQSMPVMAFDCNESTCKIAAHNLQVYEASNSRVETGKFPEINLSEFACLNFDPDRRVAGRTILPSDFSPSLSEVLNSVNHRLTAIKVAPATNLPHSVREQVHREWIGENREAKQQVIWLNHPEKIHGAASCTVITKKAIEQLVFDNADQFSRAPMAEQIGRFVFEPHSAVIASRMVNGLAHRFGLSRIGPGAAYLTGDERIQTALAACFEVEFVCPLQIEKISSLIRSHHFGEIEWKKRSIERETYEQLIRLRTKGERKVTAIVTPTPKGAVVIFGQRIVANSP